VVEMAAEHQCILEQSLRDMAHKKIYEPLSVYALFQRDAMNRIPSTQGDLTFFRSTVILNIELQHIEVWPALSKHSMRQVPNREPMVGERSVRENLLRTLL
jgi:hypothetical protein